MPKCRSRSQRFEKGPLNAKLGGGCTRIAGALRPQVGPRVCVSIAQEAYLVRAAPRNLCVQQVADVTHLLRLALETRLDEWLNGFLRAPASTRCH